MKHLRRFATSDLSTFFIRRLSQYKYYNNSNGETLMMMTSEPEAIKKPEVKVDISPILRKIDNMKKDIRKN